MPCDYTVIAEVSNNLISWSDPFERCPNFVPTKVKTLLIETYYDVAVIDYLTEENAEYPAATV